MRFLRSLLHSQESGLFLVVLALGTILTVFGGSVRTRLFERGPDGNMQPAFTTDSSGDRVPAFGRKNVFLNAQNLTSLAKDTSFIAIMAVGMAVVIISGGIDLSIACIYALASVIGAVVLQHFGPEGVNNPSSSAILLGMLACIGTGLLCGLFNGGLIIALGVHPFVITLGAMAIFRGIAFVITNGQSVGHFPEKFQSAIRYQVGDGLTVVPLVVTLVVLVIGWIFLSRLAAGRRVYAIGGNELAARFSGIRVEKVKLGVYLISGLTAGIAAVLSIGYYGAATSGDGNGYELNVIAASVVGGASLTGGRGSALGVVLGALIFQMISSGIVILHINQNYSQIITGAVLIAAVVLDNINTWLGQRRLTAQH